MDIIRAREILETLADGVNPMTGEVLSECDSCNQVEVVRALHTVLKQLESAPAKTRKPQAANAGKPWTDDDDRSLCEMFDQGCTDKEISNHFGRSKGAITARLVRLGKIADRVGLK